MGCVTSKHLKKQAINDGWISPPSRTMPRPKTVTSGYSVECYHRHCVSLTSTTYGSLKVESPKHAEPRYTRERAAVASLSDMYGTLRSLEMAAPAHSPNSMHNNVNKSPWHARNGQHFVSESVISATHTMPVSDITRNNNYPISQAMEPANISPLSSMNIMHSTFTSGVPGSPPLALEPSHEWCMSSAELGLPETINVKEMMMGLEEAAPLSQDSSPAKHTHSNAGTPRTKAQKQHNKHLKRKADGLTTATHICTAKKCVAASSREWSNEGDEGGKENNSPLHSQHIKKALPKMATSPISQTSNTSFKSTIPRRDAGVLIPLTQQSQQATLQAARELGPPRKENIVARKAAFERGSFFTTTSQNNKSSPGLSSASTASVRSVHYAPASNGKVTLTLHTHQNDNAPIVRTPSPLPARSMSRRLAFGGGLGSSELSSPTFDPELVASYEKVLSDVSQVEWNATHVDRHNLSSAETGVGRPWLWSSMSMPIAELDKRLYDPLECFEENCPPGGANGVVLYTTTLRGIRKTFEDCNTAREILESFGLSIDERDVSMHLEFLNELRELMGRVVSVPRVFIKGRYIGGAEEVAKLHEDGKLGELVEGLPKQLNGGSCDGCGGVRFVPCLECSGSCKLRSEEDNRVMRCPDCNENGLIQCPICT